LRRPTQEALRAGRPPSTRGWHTKLRSGPWTNKNDFSRSSEVARACCWQLPPLRPPSLDAKRSARSPRKWLAIVALLAFLVSTTSSVYVLLPKADKFVFSLVGSGLYEGLYEVRNDLAEVFRRLAYDLDRFWDRNDDQLQKLFQAFRLASVGLTIEIVALIAMVSDNLF
jgi:hypothetical protein